MEKVQLKVLGLSYSHTQTGAYVLVMSDVDSDMRIPIIIGGFEAQAIAIQLEKINPPRPLTHDLFVNFANAFQVELLEVNINKMSEGVFYSELLCKKGDSTIKLDARTSDAVSLAIRFDCPIYTTKEILEKSGIIMKTEDKAKGESNATGYSSLSLSKLEELLDKAIKEENYEEAALINKEITKRKTKE